MQLRSPPATKAPVLHSLLQGPCCFRGKYAAGTRLALARWRVQAATNASGPGADNGSTSLEVSSAAAEVMACKQMVYMNQGEGQTSYARNSGIQNMQQNRMRPLIEEAITDLCCNTSTLLPRKMVIVDLGCSSGPNALALVSTAVESIRNNFIQLQQPPPEVCVLLNDLHHNDFNTVVKSLDTFKQTNEIVVMTGIVPGSFYERLFTSDDLHLVCSSNSLQWLSKAPEVLTANQVPVYDTCEYARHERLAMVLDAYAHQFRKDFTHFLELRAKELLPGGRMVFSIIGRHPDGTDSKYFFWEFMSQILSAMVLEGVIDKARLDSFYIPIYGPSQKELREIIQEEGSFKISDMLVHDFTSGVDSSLITPTRFANTMRAVFEPIIVQHFGEVMDEFVRATERHWSPEGSLEYDLARWASLTLSLSKA